MDHAKAALIADILVGFMAIASTGRNLQQVVDEVRNMEKQGATPDMISAWLRESADKAVKDMFDAVSQPRPEQ